MMAENPDRKSGVHGKFAPSLGDLRFVNRLDDKLGLLRILQRWEWSYTDAKYDWYDVQWVKDEIEETG
jgi:hypothetical protein